jgi:L-lactate dehydrogenase complex protein LldG
VAGSRDRILARLRRAGGSRAAAAAEAEAEAEPPTLREETLFADYPEASESLLDRFCERFEALKGECLVVRDEDAAAIALLELLESAPPGSVVTQPDALLARLFSSTPALERLRAGAGALEAGGPAFAEFAAGVSVAECLVARTGSVLLRDDTCGGRRLTVLPPLHIVVAHARQLVPSIGGALERIAGKESWHYATFVSGPSRTADIEKILVLGAHGPKRVAALVIDS